MGTLAKKTIGTSGLDAQYSDLEKAYKTSLNIRKPKKCYSDRQNEGSNSPMTLFLSSDCSWNELELFEMKWTVWNEFKKWCQPATQSSMLMVRHQPALGLQDQKTSWLLIWEIRSNSPFVDDTGCPAVWPRLWILVTVGGKMKQCTTNQHGWLLICLIQLVRIVSLLLTTEWMAILYRIPAIGDR